MEWSVIFDILPSELRFLLAEGFSKELSTFLASVPLYMRGGSGGTVQGCTSYDDLSLLPIFGGIE